jgi:hypothetical protein
MIAGAALVKLRSVNVSVEPGGTIESVLGMLPENSARSVRSPLVVGTREPSLYTGRELKLCGVAVHVAYFHTVPSVSLKTPLIVAVLIASPSSLLCAVLLKPRDRR